ncbi:MAG TPA: hypothetical protein VFS52_08700 [Steroidobacteraceae bacterium]|jgi:hypothetical protein|nr:hypothetical protein [Steroidobacteraceae bacterium]
MKRFWFVRALKFALIALIVLAVVSAITMLLWNWLVPALFAGPRITFWQTLGLLVLSRLLLGGLRPRGPFGHGHHRHFGHGRFGHRMHRHWSRMTREERNAMRQKMRQELREHLRGRGFCPRSSRDRQEPETDV